MGGLGTNANAVISRSPSLVILSEAKDLLFFAASAAAITFLLLPFPLRAQTPGQIRFDEIGEKAGVRHVHRTRRFSGKNGDVLNLMFPKRYWFCCLKVVVHITALAALAIVVWRVGSIDDADATSASFFGAVDQEVNVAILLLAVSWLVYFITVLMAFNQKSALQRRIKELSAVLQN